MNLNDYDLIMINSSAGKDSLTTLDYISRMADEQNFNRERIIVVHANLGRAEWKGTLELAEHQATCYGLRFEWISRKQGLLEQIVQRGKWPSSSCRYCTSDHKRDQISKVITKEVRKLKLGRPVKVLNVMGIRAQESPARAKKNPFSVNKRLTGKGTVKQVWDWFPIFDWHVDQVWESIRTAGVKHHWAYDIGMKRLSCVFCIFAPKKALEIAAEYNSELLDEYKEMERKMNHSFREDFSIAEVNPKNEKQGR